MSKLTFAATTLFACAGLTEAQQSWVVNNKPLGFEVQGLASDPNSGVVYGCTESDELITIDLTTGTGTLVGPLGFSLVRGLAFDPSTGTLYGSAVSDRLLLTIDPLTGAATSIGSFGPQFPPQGLAFDPSTGTLFGSDSSNQQLLSIDVTTGLASVVGSYGFGIPFVGGLTIDPSTGELFGTSNRLYRIDKTTGAATEVGTLDNLYLPRGLCVDPASGQLIGSVFDSGGPSYPAAVVSIDSMTASTLAIHPPEQMLFVQDAIDAAAPGDLVHLMPGTYGNATITKTLRLVGSGSGTNSPFLAACRFLTIAGISASERLVVSDLNMEGASIKSCDGPVLFSNVEATGIESLAETILVQQADDVRMHRARVIGNGPGFGDGPPGIVCGFGSRLELVECNVYGGPGIALSGGSFSAEAGLRALSGSETHIALSDIWGGNGFGPLDSPAPGVVLTAGSDLILSGVPGKSLIRGGSSYSGANNFSIKTSGTLRYSGISAPDGISGTATVAIPADPTLELSGFNLAGMTVDFVVYGPPGALGTLLLGSDPIVQSSPGVLVDRLVSALVAVPLGTIPAGGMITGSYTLPDPVFGTELIAQAELLIDPSTLVRTNSAMATPSGSGFLDCNGNGLPDHCDAAILDCNANGIPDDCDAAAGGDANGNGVLDDCEVPSTYCSAKLNSDGCFPTLAFSGTPSLTSAGAFILSADLVVSQVNGQFFYGLNGSVVAPLQGGTLCAQPPLRRATIQNSGGAQGLPCNGTLSFDFNAWIQAGNEPFAQDGLQVNGQFWYRDSSDPQGVGLTEAVEFYIGQ